MLHSDGPDLVHEDVDEEKAKVDHFTAKTCNCHFGPKSTPCSTLFDREIIAKTRMNCREMNKTQLDLVVLANLEAHQHHHDLVLTLTTTFMGIKFARIFFFLCILLVLSSIKRLCPISLKMA